MPATLLDYAHMAAAIYADDESNGVDGMMDRLTAARVTGWTVRFWQAGTPSNGFQGAILESDDEVICVFKGSKGKPWDKSTTGYNDWCINDVQITLNQLPSQTHSAVEMVFVAEEFLCAGGRKPLSVVGHSLGGGLAQLVGWLRGCPFVTFNAPGMKGNTKGVTVVGKAPASAVKGFNMILWTDPVGNFGRHLGKTERFMTPGALNPRGGGALAAHQMGNVILALQRRPAWAGKELADLL